MTRLPRFVQAPRPLIFNNLFCQPKQLIGKQHDNAEHQVED
jgi:hypothetical protein